MTIRDDAVNAHDAWRDMCEQMDRLRQEHGDEKFKQAVREVMDPLAERPRGTVIDASYEWIWEQERRKAGR